MAKIQIPRNDNALPLRCVKIHSLSNAKNSLFHYLWTDPPSTVKYCLNHKLWIFLGKSFHLTLSPDALPITEMRSAARSGDYLVPWTRGTKNASEIRLYMPANVHGVKCQETRNFQGDFKAWTATPFELSTQYSVTFADNVYCPMLTICTTGFNVKKILRSAHTVYFSVLHRPRNTDNFPTQHPLTSCYNRRLYLSPYIQQDATLHSLFISGNCSTCFGWYLHPSSGAHTTVSTASGICQTDTATCRYSGR